MGPVRAAWGRGKVAWGGVGLSRVEYHGTDAQASLGRVGPVRAYRSRFLEGRPQLLRRHLASDPFDGAIDLTALDVVSISLSALPALLSISVVFTTKESSQYFDILFWFTGSPLTRSVVCTTRPRELTLELQIVTGSVFV